MLPFNRDIPRCYRDAQTFLPKYNTVSFIVSFESALDRPTKTDKKGPSVNDRFSRFLMAHHHIGHTMSFTLTQWFTLENTGQKTIHKLNTTQKSKECKKTQQFDKTTLSPLKTLGQKWDGHILQPCWVHRGQERENMLQWVPVQVDSPVLKQISRTRSPLRLSTVSVV